ncbi:MAG: hypothetical protein ACRDAX_01465 [Propionibacteriaceae bacterium]
MTELSKPSNWMKDFTELTGDRKSGEWICRLQLNLIMAGMPEAEAIKILHEIREEVLRTGNTPQQIFGSADQYAADQIGELNMSGVTFIRPQTTWRQSILLALWGAATFAISFGVIDSTKSMVHDWGPGDLLKLLSIMLALIFLSKVKDRLLLRHSELIADLGASFAILPFIIASLMAASYRAGSWGTHYNLWWFAIAAIFITIALLVRRIFPVDTPAIAKVSSDDEWLSHAEAALHQRDDLTSKQIHELLDEVKEYAFATQTNLFEEFGDPHGFAYSLASRPSVGLLPTAILGTISVIIIAAIIISSGLKFWYAIFLGLMILGVVLLWVSYILSKVRH